MANCKKCGVEVEEGVELCEACKAAAEETETAPAEPETVQVDYAPVEPETPKASGVLNVGMLVWSIVNCLLCCMPLGVASLVMTIMAKSAPTAEDEAKKLKIAKICNICSTVFGAIVNVLSFFLGLLGGLSDAGVL